VLELPTVGDWVTLDAVGPDTGVIRAVLPRRSLCARMAAGRTPLPQAIAASLDTIFICMALNGDFNPRRLERYLTLAWDSGATPVVVLTKADLCADIPGRLAALHAVAAGADVVVCSAENASGLDAVAAYTGAGQTVAFIGASGAGKSTLINRLAGQELLATGAVRAGDDRGRHTTTYRSLIPLPGGGVVIDTPGMRELQLLSGDTARAFEDITALAGQCRFADCTHTGEPGCAVRAAIDRGALPEGRLTSFLKLRREELRADKNARHQAKIKLARAAGNKKAAPRARIKNEGTED
jgi:ribosome biogenesis GTPase